MHEMGIAMEIIRIAMESIPASAAGSRVTRVYLRVGKLSAIVPDSLRFCFGVATQDSALAGAVLDIEEVPIRARCNRCDIQWEIDGPVFRCPSCDSGDILLLSGRELEVVSIDIDEEEDHA